MDLHSLLMGYLGESGPACADRTRRIWTDRCPDPAAPLVLFGAGNLGRKVRQALDGTPHPVLAFADNDPAKWGTWIDGVPVLPPGEACRRHGDQACFVVTIWRAEGEPHRYPDTEARLAGLGARRIAHFCHLACAYPDGLVPHYSMDLPEGTRAAGEAVRRALDRFREPRSREIFLRHALWRLTLDFSLLPATDPEEIYFPEGLFRAGVDETLVDAGGFDGDTCRRMLELWGPGARAIHAFEPDPINGARFRDWLSTCPDRDRIVFHPTALGRRTGTAAFEGSGRLDASAAAQGGVQVQVQALDQLLAEDPPAFIKMDIEGAELDALSGAERLVRRGPRLAICLYHRQDHLWTLPNLLGPWLPGHQFHLRYHGTDAWELVLYTVPPGVA